MAVWEEFGNQGTRSSARTLPGAWNGWAKTDVYDGTDTHMVRAFEVEQAWGRAHEDYLNRNAGMVRLSELWYRHYEEGYVLALPDGNMLEYREDNPYHVEALTQGVVQAQKTLLQRVRVSIWLGPHKLMDVIIVQWTSTELFRVTVNLIAVMPQTLQAFSTFLLVEITTV